MKSKLLFPKLILLSGLSASIACFGGTTTGIYATLGGNGIKYVQDPDLDANGQFLAFSSEADYLVVDDNNGKRDIFVYDIANDSMERVSVSGSGLEGNNDSFVPSISGDGRYVVFESTASNLSPDDSNTRRDIFLHDRQTGETKLISRGLNGEPSNGASGNGRISADGQVITFESHASNLVAGDTNDLRDIFAYDRASKTLSRVSVSSSGAQALSTFYPGPQFPYLSGDGRYIAFMADVDNLVPNDTNNSKDVFLRDRLTGETRRVSVDSTGAQGNDASFIDAISADGRYVVFESDASNLVANDTNGKRDIFVYDRVTEQTKRVSVANDGSEGGSNASSADISANGRFVVFGSAAGNLVANDTNKWGDIFIRDLQLGTTKRLSISATGEQANYISLKPVISANGQRVAFTSEATNLIGSAAPGTQALNVYLHTLETSPQQPANLELTATVDSFDTQERPGPALPYSGSPATWHFDVSNTGDKGVSNVRLFGKVIEPVEEDNWTRLCQLGDIVGQSMASCSVDTLVVEGSFKMLLSARGYDESGNKVMVNGPAWYVGGSDSNTASLLVRALLNGSDNDNTSPGEVFAVGETVTYTYIVTNTGPFEVKNVGIFDRYHQNSQYHPVDASWHRACSFTTLQPAETAQCTRNLTVEAGEFRRDISAQTYYQSTKVVDNDVSYLQGE